MGTTAIGSERTPLQTRSRQSWERVLAVGMELFEEGGWPGLTIAEVCRRARVSAPSIYARVDGKAGLFRAVHERWLAEMAGTEEDVIATHLGTHATAADAAAATAAVVCEIFRRHGRALRAVIERSMHDAELLERGSSATRGLVQRLAVAIPVPTDRAEAAVRAVYAECVIRVLFGARFLARNDESSEAFESRMAGLARTIATGADQAAAPRDA